MSLSRKIAIGCGALLMLGGAAGGFAIVASFVVVPPLIGVFMGLGFAMGFALGFKLIEANISNRDGVLGQNNNFLPLQNVHNSAAAA